MADKAVEIYRTSVSSGFKVNIAAVNVMLNTFAAQNKVVDAERMLGDAKQSGLKPNAFTYAAMSRLSVKNFGKRELLKWTKVLIDSQLCACNTSTR
jgi:pentatricopeptide repeat protein